jgi:uncharacterized protein YeaO (DUF488 family)
MGGVSETISGRTEEQRGTGLKQEVANGAVTLLCGAKEEEHNEAVMLQKLLMSNR